MQLVYYAVTLLFFLFIYSILNWGLNLQFGRTGILNFAYIAFVAVGAYFSGVLSLGRPVPGSGQTYVLGATLPYPLPLLAGGLAASGLGLLVGLVAFRRLRSDYLAIVMISLSIVLYDVVTNYVPLFDGADGLNGVPQPFAGGLHLNANSFIYVFTGFAGLVALAGWGVMSRITRSPLDRVFRAIRDDPDVVRGLGRNVFRYQMQSLLIGSFFAGIGGGLLMEFVGAFNTSAWLSPETFVIFAAIIIGGLGNNAGAMVGAFAVPVIFVELPKFLPQLPGNPGLIPEVDNMIIGVLLIVTLWFRPQGLVPERKVSFSKLVASLPGRRPAEAEPQAAGKEVSGG
ncbi:MAG: branched-chain amino acid ABC transporter permease [Nocardiopsaceae bacterium]|jgi:ABC-type branched-subunit amino acid transport system permease subunit|nr:branched-chain amino acid ABC transporter permease [Nocardiopsaceae bacterium]